MFTLADLAVALDRPIDTSEEVYFQHLIDSVTAYISSETGVAFSVHTNETVRYQADGRGIIELIGPVVDLTSIAGVKPWPVTHYSREYGYIYDGLGEIYNCWPLEVVDVTYTYGYGVTEVPKDIKNAAIDAVVNAIQNGSGWGDLQEKTVGDITYRYRFTDLDFNAFGIAALNAYRGVAKTWRL